MQEIKNILIYSPAGPEQGFGTAHRFESISKYLKHNGFSIKIITSKHVKPVLRTPWVRPSVFQWIKQIIVADCFVFASSVPSVVLFALLFFRKQIIIDHYGPDFLEFFEKAKHDNSIVSKFRYGYLRKKLLFLMLVSDKILVSSQQLKLFFEGIAFQNGLLPPTLYMRDKTFSSFFPEIPYGIDKINTENKFSIAQKYFPGVNFKKPVFIWGGGVWNWFDPFLVISAVKLLKEENIFIQVLFPSVSAKPASFMKIDRAEEFRAQVYREKLNEQIIFGDSYIPYEECINLFAACWAGISIALETIENTVSFRTRIIDYIAAGIPVICTKGDVLSDIVTRDNLGIGISPGSAKELAEGLKRIASDDIFYNTCRDHVVKIQNRFLWDTVLAPLPDIIRKNEKRTKRPVKATGQLVSYSVFRFLFFLFDIKNLFKRIRVLFS